MPPLRLINPPNLSPLPPRTDLSSGECVFRTKSSSEFFEKCVLVHLATLLAIPMTSFSSKGGQFGGHEKPWGSH